VIKLQGKNKKITK